MRSGRVRHYLNRDFRPWIARDWYLALTQTSHRIARTAASVLARLTCRSPADKAHRLKMNRKPTQTPFSNTVWWSGSSRQRLQAYGFSAMKLSRQNAIHRQPAEQTRSIHHQRTFEPNPESRQKGNCPATDHGLIKDPDLRPVQRHCRARRIQIARFVNAVQPANRRHEPRRHREEGWREGRPEDGAEQRDRR